MRTAALGLAIIVALSACASALGAAEKTYLAQRQVYEISVMPVMIRLRKAGQIDDVAWAKYLVAHDRLREIDRIARETLITARETKNATERGALEVQAAALIAEYARVAAEIYQLVRDTQRVPAAATSLGEYAHGR